MIIENYRNGPLLPSLIGIFILLIFSTLVLFFLRQSHPQRDYTEVTLRIQSWWVMVIIFTIATLCGPTVSILFFAFLSYLALKEYFNLHPTREVDKGVLIWAYLAVPVQYWWIYRGWYGMFIIFIPVYMFLLLPFKMVMNGETKGFLKAAGTIHWGLMITVFCISHVAYFFALPKVNNPNGGGATLVLFLVFLTQANDISQYLWGKKFGRHPAVPTVSPGKTIEGLIGGLMTTVILAMILGPYLTPMIGIYAFLAGIIISMGGFIGDVNISAVKRDQGLKESGDLLPGHGGILDRVDSLTYTAPLFFHYTYYIYY